MKNLNPVKIKILNKDKQVSVREASKLLAEFFNGEVIKLDDACFYN